MGRIDEVTKIKGMFVHPRQVDEVAGAFPEITRCQVVVRLKGHDDEMILRVELASGAYPDTLVTVLKEKAKDLLKVTPMIEVVPSGTIAEGAKRILDERRWS
jgi:phenylacetate-CoA ligase